LTVSIPSWIKYDFNPSGLPSIPCNKAAQTSSSSFSSAKPTLNCMACSAVSLAWRK